VGGEEGVGKGREMQELDNGYPKDMVLREEVMHHEPDTGMSEPSVKVNIDITSKVCAMCRKEVDPLAVLCPYCNSNVDYQYFKSVSFSDLSKSVNIVRKLVQIVLLVLACFSFFGIGLAFGGIWVGIGAVIIACKLGLAIMSDSPSETYLYKFNCPICSNSCDVTWPATVIDESRRGYFVCDSCHKKTMISFL